jgi:phosphoribosylamine--glycine ligase
MGWLWARELFLPKLYEAARAVREMMSDKVSQRRGQNSYRRIPDRPEVSILAFTDGKTLVPMVSSQITSAP